MSLYFCYLLFQQDISPVDLSAIWAIHAIIQTFACPIWMSEKFNRARYLGWILNVVLKPAMVVGVLVVLTLAANWISVALSSVLYLSGAIILGVMVVKGGAVEKMASGR